MLTEMFPIVALGNVTMSMGMVCWTVVGAQGQYHLSTTVALTVSFVVTIPLGAIMTIGLNIDPQGLVFAIFMGYTITAMILFALILMSDWEKLSEKIQEQVASGKISLSDSSGDEMLCSSEDSESEQISIPPNQADEVPCNLETPCNNLEIQRHCEEEEEFSIRSSSSVAPTIVDDDDKGVLLSKIYSSNIDYDNEISSLRRRLAKQRYDTI
jgi:hypothetical protein